MRQLPRRVLQLQASIGLPPTELVRFRLFRFRSPLLTESLRFPFLRVLRCFSSPAYLLIAYGFSDGSPGSQPAGGSPRLIAAIHVLHRLLVPRHPPYALASSASRSLDLTKPAGSTFSTKNPCSGRYPCVLSVLSAQLLFDSSGTSTSRRGTKKARRPSSHFGRAGSRKHRLCDCRLPVTDGPFLLEICVTQWTTSIARPRIFTIANLLRTAQVLCPFCGGGAEGIRTPDLRRAKAALSQLSYGPWTNPPHGWASLESNQGPQSYQDCALAD
jgi:hypothetical protein